MTTFKQVWDTVGEIIKKEGGSYEEEKKKWEELLEEKRIKDGDYLKQR